MGRSRWLSSGCWGEWVYQGLDSNFQLDIITCEVSSGDFYLLNEAVGDLWITSLSWMILPNHLDYWFACKSIMAFIYIYIYWFCSTCPKYFVFYTAHWKGRYEFNRSILTCDLFCIFIFLYMYSVLNIVWQGDFYCSNLFGILDVSCTLIGIFVCSLEIIHLGFH